MCLVPVVAAEQKVDLVVVVVQVDGVRAVLMFPL